MHKIIYIVQLVLALSMVPLAYATNESSYQYGFNMADFKAKSGCDDTDGDCEPSAAENCHTESWVTNVTNETACVDGFVNAWRATCMSQLKLCAIQVLEGVFPGSLEDNKTVPECFAKWDGNGFDANTRVLPTHLTTELPHSGNYGAVHNCPPIRGKIGY